MKLLERNLKNNSELVIKDIIVYKPSWKKNNIVFLIFVTGCAISKMTNNNADQANHKDSNKEKEKKHDSGEIFFHTSS